MIGRTTSRTDQTVIAHDGLRGGDRDDDISLRKHDTSRLKHRLRPLL